MARKRFWTILVVATSILGLVALDAAARGGRGGGGRGGGGRGGGRGGFGRGMGRGGGMPGMGGRTGGRGGFGMGRFGRGNSSAKEWEILKEQEDRRKRIQERREYLMGLARLEQQEAREDQLRLDAALGEE